MVGFSRRARGVARRAPWLALLVTLGTLAGTTALPAAQAAAPLADLELQAPRSVKVGEPIFLVLAVRNAADIAGYEAQLTFDTTAADFDGLRQRANDLKSVGRDVASLGPIEQPSGVVFGLYSCPLASCLDRGTARRARGGGGRVQLATVSVTPRRAGTLELHLSDAKFVDADGNDVAVQGSETTVRVQVGNQGPLFSAPAVPGSPVSAVSTSGPGPFDLSHDGVVDHADSVQVAFGWTQLRQQGVVCGPAVPLILDVNHDGCLDVADAQLVASHFSGPGRTGAAEPPTAALSDVVADATDQSAAAVDAAMPLDAPELIVVNSTADTDDASPGDGVCLTNLSVCTLRAAIQEANAHPGPDSISFNIPGASGVVRTITASGGLPLITDGGTTIDGYTQPGATPNSLVATDNAHLLIEVTGGATSNGLVVGSANNIIRGLSIWNYQVNVQLFGQGATGNLIAGNFLGTNPAATFQPPANPGPAGTSGAGVSVFGATRNQIGSPNRADRNVISGNSGSGVAFFTEGSDYNSVYNNLIGMNPSGLSRVLNTKHGVDINGPASFNVIGGLGVGQRNVIGGNLENGVEYSHMTLTVENQTVGNYIGTDVSGDASPSYLANGGYGVHIHDGPTNNTVSDNVIGNSVLGGIRIHDFNNWGNRIINNRIGIGSAGSPIPNQQFGIEVGFDANNVTIGPGNIIANNPDGIVVPNTATTGVTITRNSIFNNVSVHSCGPGNTGRGIDLAPLYACAPNDPTSPSPANNGILGPTFNGSNVNTADTRTCAGCTVEVFLADAAGQGQTFVGKGVADGSGRALVPLSGVAVGQAITATTTDKLGDTSEFASPVAVGSTSLGTPTPTPVPAALPAALDTFTRTVANGWGTADAGGTWATEPLGTHQAGAPFPGYDVNGSVGTMLFKTTDPASQYRSAYLTDVAARDVDVTFRVRTDVAPPSGGFLFTWVAMRRTGSGTGFEYLGRVTLAASGTTLQAFKISPCSTLPCAPVAFGAVGSAPQAHFIPGNFLRVRAQVQGANPTTIRLKAWDDGQPEPSTWAVQETDGEPALQQAGSVGLRAFVAGTLTQPITFGFDDFTTTSLSGVPTPTPTGTSTPSPLPTQTPTPTSTLAPLTSTATPISTSTPAPTNTPGGPPSNAVTLLTSPVRLVDTRSAGGAITPGKDRCFSVAGVSGIPASATGVVVNLTAVGYTGRGWLTLYPAGQTLPSTSTLNFDSTEFAIANGAVVRIGSNGQVCVAAGQVAANAVVDAIGYEPAAAATLMPLLSSPARLADTRASGGPIQPGSPRCFAIAGQGGIPATATGVLLNLTVVGYTGSGWLTVYPFGQALPATSTLNFDPSEWAIANNAIIKLGSGQICISAGQAASQVIIDAVGYLTPAGGLPLLTQPQRLVDTRTSGGVVVPGADRCFTVAGRGGIPATATGVVLNLTSTGHTGRGWLTLYPAGQPNPATSTLNFETTEAAIANGTFVRLGTNGQVCVAAGQASAQVIADATGYLP